MAAPEPQRKQGSDAARRIGVAAALAALGGVALLRLVHGRRGVLLGCPEARRPGMSRETLHLTSSHLRWLAGTSEPGAAPPLSLRLYPFLPRARREG